MCSRIILFNFLYLKERADREESNATTEFILAIVFPEIHSVIVFFISLFDEMSIFCCFCTYNYVFPIYLIFFMQKKEQTERNPMQHGIHPSYLISRDTLCYSVLHFIIR